MIHCVIIDDEPKAIELLKLYCDRLPDLTIKATFRDPVEALQYLNGQAVDLIFLDINMPKINGMSLAKIIDDGINIVFTTAYAEYAVESYELGAVDYLLKPISFDRFYKCIEKFNQSPIGHQEKEDFISVRSGTTTYRLKHKDILYLEKDGNYCFYVLADKRIMARESVSEALLKLPNHFIQIHKSIIINTHHVSQFSTDQVVIQSKSLPISDTFRKNAIDCLTP